MRKPILVKALWALLLSCSLLGVTVAQTNKTRATEQALLELIKQLVAAQQNFDAAALDKLLAADYVEVSPVGEVDERAKVIGFYAPAAKAAAGPAVTITVDEPQYRLRDNTALVIVRESFQRKVGDQVRDMAMRASFTLRKEQGRWLIASAQYTGIRPPQAK